MGISNSIAKGAALMVLFKLIERSLGFISTLILARLLVPGDFGLMAMATSFIALIELIGAFGFDISLIRMERPERAHFDSAWTLNVAVGALVALLMVAAAIPLAHFYSEPRLPAVVCVLAVGSVVSSLENIGIVEFRRKLEFGREFRFQLAKKLAAFSVTVPLAFLLRNYWALVAGMLVGRVASSAWSYAIHPYRPRLSLAAARDLFGFSKWLLITNALYFLKERGSDFIVGRISGRTALGLFTVGYEIANLPTTELVAPINRAVFPGYARIAGDLGALRTGFLEVIGLVTLCAVPAGIGIAAVAPLACAVLLGPKWLEAIPIIEIVAIHGAVTALQSNVFAVYLALGRPDLPTRITAGYVAVLLTLTILLTASQGIRGTALACLITAAVFAPINYAVLLRMLRISIGRLAEVMWRPVLSSCVMYAVARTSADALVAHVPAFIALMGAVAAGAAAYLLCVLLLWRIAGLPAGSESMVLQRARSVVHRFAPAARA